MTRYLGPAHTIEWPKDSGNVYTRGDEVPFSDEDIAKLRGVGHSFQNGDDYMGEQIPPPRQPDPAQAPTQAAAAGFTGEQQGGEAQTIGAQVAQQAHQASIEGNPGVDEPDLGGSQPGTAEIGDRVGGTKWTSDENGEQASAVDASGQVVPAEPNDEPPQQSVAQGLDVQGGQEASEQMPAPEGQGEQVNPGGLDALTAGESHLAGDVTREQAEADAAELTGDESPKGGAPTEDASAEAGDAEG